jgi:hypothetical protein
MLIQCFAQTQADVTSAMSMIHYFHSAKVKQFRIELWKDIREGFYDYYTHFIYDDARKEIDQQADYSFDNVGVYYNDGETIFVKIYKNAKSDFAAYRHEDEPDTITDASTN